MTSGPVGTLAFISADVTIYEVKVSLLLSSNDIDKTGFSLKYYFVISFEFR